ncbi:uncharacterized protein LOC130946291 [Arachis stenosperma]|uniref:uncharacterized protein LOC130946291 n=1 Tax=Arachis stenosperma TaxID=217475 RepID=UPI0025AB7FEC|nr:uncharacterized protein LOC130946291 [Arachis stenosperma]
MSRKLSDSSKPEKSFLSYADLHHEITKSEEEISLESNDNHLKQEDCRMASEEDELVKYMSKLPGYLERGVNINEKVLNVGVLDWARLEQWKCSYKHVPDRSSQSLSSTSHTSSSTSADGFSGKSNRGPSLSPCQRIFRPSIQSHSAASSVQENPGVVKSFGGGVGNFQNVGGGRHSNGVTNGKHVRAGDHLPQNYPTIIPKVCKRESTNPYNDRESGILPNVRGYETASCTKLEINKQNGGSEKRVENLSKSNIDTVDQGAVRESKPIVVLLPRDNPQNSHCAAPNMQTSSDFKLGTPSLTKYSEKVKEHSHKHACHLSNEVSSSCSQFKGSGSSPTDLESIKVPASTISAPFPVKGGISPCKSRKTEERKQTIATTLSANGPPHGINQKVTTEKSRSSSPFHRLGISIGFTSKSGCKDTSHVPHQSSSATLKSSSEHVRGYARSNISGNDRAGDAAKGRTSPLRRLLDPLLKPKAATSSHSMESSQKDSMLINKNSRLSNEKISILMPERESDRDHRVGCATINAANSSKEKKYMASTFQGLLRIAVKNGQPLFTFAVDNNSNILAATVKSLPVSAEDECKCIYTFFTFRENKKKNGIWMNQTGKSKGPDYIHHVVAQMKVSDLHHYDSASQNFVNSSAKEFVLFSVKPRQGDSQVTDYQPNDELAAIVVKSPRAINVMKYEHQSSCQNDIIKNNVGVTVVLPGGVHSLPSNGGPSSLIERWKTGGSCDCGGWDLACKLKIFANEKHTCGKSGTSKAYLSDRFELFLQGNDQDQGHQPAFSFSPFRPGIYSVAFDSSLSHLQAFSVCISLVDGRMPYELCRSRDSTGVKNLREMMLAQTEELKAFGTSEDTPASYVAYPPLSPVGRV